MRTDAQNRPRSDATEGPRHLGTPLPGGWLTAAEAALYLGLPSRGALFKRVERGQVRAYRLGRFLRFRRADLDALMVPVRGSDAVGSLPVGAVAGEENRRW